MQSLFSCLFALLLYAGSRAQRCGLLPASQEDNRGRNKGRRTDDAVEIMQVWKTDSSINEDVRGVRAEAAVKVCDI